MVSTASAASTTEKAGAEKLESSDQDVSHGVLFNSEVRGRGSPVLRRTGDVRHRQTIRTCLARWIAGMHGIMHSRETFILRYG